MFEHNAVLPYSRCHFIKPQRNKQQLRAVFDRRELGTILLFFINSDTSLIRLFVTMTAMESLYGGGRSVKLKKESGARKRVVMRILAIAASTISVSATVISFIYMRRNYPGMNIAFFIALGISALIIAHLFLCSLRASEKHPKLAKTLQRCFFICLAIGFAGFLTLQVLILSASRTEDADVDCLIVLGAGIYGETPSRILASRLDSALEYIAGRDGVQIIVSGGQGPGESITEAEAMFRYLTRRGADANLIWKEERSTSTLENLAFSLELLEEMGLDKDTAKVAIVTNEFHLYRAKHVAGLFGIDAIGVAAKTPYPSLRVLYHFREAAAILNSFLFCKSM